MSSEVSPRCLQMRRWSFVRSLDVECLCEVPSQALTKAQDEPSQGTGPEIIDIVSRLRNIKASEYRMTLVLCMHRVLAHDGPRVVSRDVAADLVHPGTPRRTRSFSLLTRLADGQVSMLLTVVGIGLGVLGSSSPRPAGQSGW